MNGQEARIVVNCWCCHDTVKDEDAFYSEEDFALRDWCDADIVISGICFDCLAQDSNYRGVVPCQR